MLSDTQKQGLKIISAAFRIQLPYHNQQLVNFFC